MGHHFELRKDVELAATPEQVWEAIATGPGIDSWFMGRTEVEPGEGGRTRLTMAGQVEESTITAWEPGKRLADRTEPAPDGTFMALEYLIEGREQGSTTLRLVQSGVLGDNWESEYEAMGIGWDMYLGTLAAYLAHFPGRTAAPVSAFRPDAGGADRVWAAVAEAFGVAGPIAEGDRVRFTVGGLPPIEGVVDLAGLPTYVGVRTDDALYRFLYSGAERGDALVLGHHVFATGQDPARAERAWQDWLAALPVG
ncbi:SRPBCC family protein [Micromonospora sp. URMC 107]|uniref:SRPBCC family protein n=1 Tax=Micromonospora sp. URMC 107 TaxID=3423418 RepID=UPI003F1C932F